MTNRLRYMSRRATRIPRMLATPTGAVAVAAVVAGLVALLLEGGAATVAGAVSLLLWLAAFLVMADRVRIAAGQRRSTSPEQPPMPGTDGAVSQRRLTSAKHAIHQVAPRALETGSRSAAVQQEVMARNPVVSIVVPCFNDVLFIRDCLQSLMNQTYRNWECVIVDDASTDSSVLVAWEFAKRDSRFRVVRHTRNLGLASARNTGLRLAEGDYVTFLDSDDFLSSDSLTDRVLHLVLHDADPDFAGVYCGVTLVPEDAVLSDYALGLEWSGNSINFVTSGDYCPFNVHAALVNRSILVAAGGFDESMRHGAEDWDLWYRLLRNGFRFEPSATDSAFYRQRSSSMRRVDASAHFVEATRLTKASQGSPPASIMFASGIIPMNRGRDDYVVATRLARRAIQSASTSLIAGDEGAAVKMLASIETIHPSVLRVNVRPMQAINDGFRRYLALRASELPMVLDQLAPLTKRVLELVDEYVKIEEGQTVPELESFGVLLLPQTGAQLGLMLATLSSSDLRVGVVDLSATAGDQGVADMLQAIEDKAFSVLSHNEVILETVDAQIVLLSYPRDAAIDELAMHLVGRGASAIVMPSDLQSVQHLDDAPPSRVPATEVSFEELGLIFDDGSLDSLIANARRSSTFETGLLSYKDAAAVWVTDEYPDTKFDAEEIARFKGIHAGERVVIIGNGPSLNDLDLSLLAGTHTIGVNGIFYADDLLPEQLSYYVVEDSLVVRDNLQRIAAYKAGHRFFPSIYREMIGESANTSFFMMNRGFYARKSPAFCVPRFSTDVAQRIYAGQSVTTMNLQLAYYMGFTEVILIGMDFSYSIPDSSIIDGAHITSTEDDPNHFHPDYFGKGKVWKDPKLDRVLANYALAKQMYEADGRRIINATPAGNLHLFDRKPFDEIFRS